MKSLKPLVDEFLVDTLFVIEGCSTIWLPMTMSGVSGAGVLVLTPQRYATVREDSVGRPFSHATPRDPP